MKNIIYQEKKRTYKKYNKTQFRNFNKHINLTSKMKGGVNLSPFGKSKQYVDAIIWKENLETLLTKIKTDKTFKVVGAPLGPPLYEYTTQKAAIKQVEDALDANQKISEIERRKLEAYITHYITRQQSEISFENGKLNTSTHSLIPYSEMRTRAQELLDNINILDYTEELGDYADWLKKYIQFLDTNTYFSITQDREIMAKMAAAEKAAAEAEAAEEKAAAAAAAEEKAAAEKAAAEDKAATDAKVAVPLDSDQLNTHELTEKHGGKSKRIFKRNVKSKKRSKKRSKN